MWAGVWIRAGPVGAHEGGPQTRGDALRVPGLPHTHYQPCVRPPSRPYWDWPSPFPTPQVCNYRSSFFSDVETHFRTVHENTKELLCPFCLKILRSGHMYMQHYMKHQVCCLDSKCVCLVCVMRSMPTPLKTNWKTKWISSPFLAAKLCSNAFLCSLFTSRHPVG